MDDNNTSGLTEEGMRRAEEFMDNVDPQLIDNPNLLKALSNQFRNTPPEAEMVNQKLEWVAAERFDDIFNKPGTQNTPETQNHGR